MGCCYSYEEEDPEPPRPVPVLRRPTPQYFVPTPTATSFQSHYDSYYNQQHRDTYRAVPPPTFRSIPVRTNVAKPNVRAVVIKPTQEFKAVPPPTFRSIPVRTNVAKPNVRAVVIKPTQEFKPRPGALYGEYKCRCGYFWVSRLSWRDKYQQCKRCKAFVRPKNQRELRPSDFTRGENDEGLDHPQELCEMCKQVGGYCGKYK